MMNQRRSMILSCAAILFCIPHALADTHVCTTEEAQKAEMVAAVAKSWIQLQQQFNRFAHCDDGAIAEGFSESISLLLAEHWEVIGQLEAIRIADPAFGAFVIQHIDGTAPADRLGRITTNAEKQCPKGLMELCRDIKNAAQQAN